MRWLRRFFYSDDPLVRLVGSLSEPEAEMWRELLVNEGIPAMVKNISALSVAYGASPANSFDLFVRESDLERAQELLAPHEPGKTQGRSGSSDADGGCARV
jgi:hypothetical protein